ncbi:hypothetical protein M2403_000804 [Rahnella sp. BIGb0603]|nr:hypothetical protein [Rahnella sp. BIGb0603]
MKTLLLVLNAPDVIVIHAAENPLSLPLIY